MADNSINIYISKGKGQSTNADNAIEANTPDEQDTSENADNKAGGGDTTGKLVAAALVDMGKQYAMNAINQFGNFTGNTIAQERINLGIQIIASAATFAVNPIIGSIAVVSQLAINVTNNAIEMVKQNNEAELMRTRSGNVARSGGRGTNN